MTTWETFKRSSLDDTTLDFTRSMYSFGGIEYFLTEKDFVIKIFVNDSLKFGKVIWVGQAELKLGLDQPSIPNALLDLRI